MSAGDSKSGFGWLGPYTATITNGKTACDEINFGRPVAWIAIACADFQRVQSTTLMTLAVGYAANDALVLLGDNDPNVLWSKSLPTTGGRGWQVTQAGGIQRLQIRMDKAASGGDVPYVVYGFDPGIAG